MRMLIIRALLAVLLIASFAGCAGYQLGAVKPSAYANIDKIFVPPFKNDTLEPRISSLVTSAVLKEIQMDGTYQVAKRHDADAILRGRVERITKYQLRGVRTETLRSQELGLYLYIRWYLEDPSTGQEITMKNDLEAKDVTLGDETIRVVPGVVVGSTIQFVDASYQVGERNAVAVAAEDAAKKLVDQMSEGW
ncbi:MAG: LPS assembly lipoprotein LptE [Verrucomicrobiales bacterium]|nr:LPS assembly lipoprotein LptE [Verrucomicrobiales bacterium]